METKEKRYEDFVSDGLKRQKDVARMWDVVERLYDGDYKPLIGTTEIDYYVKTYMMATSIETAVAISMPPPNFKFIVEPANKEQEPDINSAKTARALANYYIHKKGGYAKVEDGVTDYFLLNRCVFRVFYRPSDEENLDTEGAVVDPDVFYTEGGDNGKGQAGFDKVERKDFIISDGFKTIRDAEVSGGKVACRFYPHVDWVKNNPAFKSFAGKKLKEYKGQLKYPNQELYDGKTEKSVTVGGRLAANADDSRELEYVRLWYVYEYPTADLPSGRFGVYDYDQRVLLYEVDNFRQFLGIDFPFYEAVDTIPRRGYYAIPKSYRAKNAQLRTEYFETKILEQTKDSKSVIVVPKDSRDEVLERVRDNNDAIVVLETESGKPQDGVYTFDIKHDLEAAERGALRSRGQFQEIIGPNFADPRMGDKIATEMVFQNKLFTTKANRHIININKLIEQIVTALITITKTMVSPEEQMRITRSVEGVWMDDNEVTLSGNYVVTVKGSPLLDMTEGERSNLIQMAAQWLSSLQAIPEYQGRIDVTSIVRDWLDLLGLPSAGVIRDSAQTEGEKQWFEITMMLSGFPMPVEPDDNDVQHLGIGEEYVTYLKENKKSLTPAEEELFTQHFTQHIQKMQQQQQGAQGVPGQNNTNIARQGAGGTVGGSALTGPVGGNNNV